MKRALGGGGVAVDGGDGGGRVGVAPLAGKIAAEASPVGEGVNATVPVRPHENRGTRGAGHRRWLKSAIKDQYAVSWRVDNPVIALPKRVPCHWPLPCLPHRCAGPWRRGLSSAAWRPPARRPTAHSPAAAPAGGDSGERPVRRRSRTSRPLFPAATAGVFPRSISCLLERWDGACSSEETPMRSCARSGPFCTRASGPPLCPMPTFARQPRIRCRTVGGLCNLRPQS